MGTTNNSALETNTHTTRLDAVTKQGKDSDVETTIGTQAGRTSIGTQAGDIGTQDIKVGQNTIKSLGLDNFGLTDVGVGKGTANSSIDGIGKPSDDQRKDAQGKMDDSVDGTGKDADALKGAQQAILGGDTEAFGKAIAQFQGKPEELKKFLDKMNENFEKNGSGVRAEVDPKTGNVIVHDGDGSAVRFTPDGQASVIDVHQNEQGGLVVSEVIGGPDAKQVMQGIGDGAVSDITDPYGIIKQPHFDPDPKFPHPDLPPLPRPQPDWPQPVPEFPEWPRHNGPGSEVPPGGKLEPIDPGFELPKRFQPRNPKGEPVIEKPEVRLL